MNSHLVAVKVGIESRAHQWVQLNGFAFDQNRLKGLDAQTVQGRCAVEQHRVLFDDLFQDVPHHGRAGFNFFLGRFDGGGNAHRLQARKDEWLEQFQGHQFGQATLVQLEGWTHGDDRTARIVHPLAQQVLAEAAALAFDHVGQRLEGALVGASHGLAAAAVVEQAVNGFLQHAFFVARNDLRRLQLQQTAQTAVAVDHPAIQVIEVRGRKAATVQGHQGAQIGRQHRQHRQHHPLWLDAGLLESFQHFEALGIFLDLDFRTRQVTTQALDFGIDFDALEQFANAFCAHLGDKFVAKLFELGIVIVLGHDAVLLQRRHARIGDHIGFKVKHALNVAQGHVQHQAQTAGQ